MRALFFLCCEGGRIGNPVVEAEVEVEVAKTSARLGLKDCVLGMGCTKHCRKVRSYQGRI